jgi:serine/threonine protein kinase
VQLADDLLHQSLLHLAGLLLAACWYMTSCSLLEMTPSSLLAPGLPLLVRLLVLLVCCAVSCLYCCGHPHHHCCCCAAWFAAPASAAPTFSFSSFQVHRDIKPANILMSLSGEAKLSDFGISATVEHTFAQVPRGFRIRLLALVPWLALYVL